MSETFLNLALALGLGLLVGLQRQRADSVLAGFRTFGLTALFGAVCSLLVVELGPWLPAVGLLALVALIVTGNLARMRRPEFDPGLTTEVAMLVMFLVGLLAGLGERMVAVVLGATTAVLLHLRTELHTFARRIGDADMRAIMQFVVIAMVVLPILPDATFGPFNVLNPHRMWWMVVLITGLSLGSYVIYKLLGARAGTVVGGLLGGLISSTATTVTYARRSKAEATAQSVPLGTMVILLASAVVFARVLILVATMGREQFSQVAPPLTMMLGVMAALAGASWWQARKAVHSPTTPENPTELKVALTFALLYGGVLLAVAAAKTWFGTQGLYVVAILSGLTDMDAITLSTTQLAQSGQLDPRTAGNVILSASLANIVFKGVVAFAIGSRALAKRIALFFGIALVAGTAILLLW